MRRARLEQTQYSNITRKQEDSKRLTNLRTQKNYRTSEIDYSIYVLSVNERAKYGLVGIAIAAIIAYVFYRSILAFIILAIPMTVVFPIYMKRQLLFKRRRNLAIEFREGITVLASTLAAGYSMENAMVESESQLRTLLGDNSMIVNEFEAINKRVAVNIPIETAWQEFSDRSGIDDIRNFVQVIKVAKRSGGELNSIITYSANTIGDKIQIKEEITTMTSAKRFEQKIMQVIPIVIVIYIDATSPGFFNAMYESPLGRIIMTACLVIYVLAIYLSGKILEIEV